MQRKFSITLFQDLASPPPRRPGAYARRLLFLVATACCAACGVLSQIPDAVDSIFPAKPLELNNIPPWRPESTESLRTLSSHGGEVLALKALGGGQQVVTVGSDGVVALWDMATGRGYQWLNLQSSVDSAALGTGHQLIAMTHGTEIEIMCPPPCTAHWTLSRLKVKARSITFHAEDTAVIIGGADGRVYQWRFLDDSNAPSTEARFKTLERYIGHSTMVTAVAGHPFGRAFFSGDIQGGLYAWLPYAADDFNGEYDKTYFGGRPYTAPQTFTRAKRALDRGIVDMAVSDNGERLVLGTEDGFVEVWEVRGFILAARQMSHRGRISSVAINEDGTLVASSGRDEIVLVQQVDKDPDYRIVADSTPFKLAGVATFNLPEVRSIIFTSEERLVASTFSGKLAEIALTTPLTKIPATPTPQTEKPATHPGDGDY